jgi:excinuclease UvrABC nuclease subunit
MEMEPVRAEKLPQSIPKRGIYLFSDGEIHLYVGRTNNLKRRLQNHCRASSNHNTATFAFRIARQETGLTQASYKSSGSRNELQKDSVFGPAFSAAKARIKSMNLRFVEEDDATRQALLEIYVATILETQFNDFENH